MKYNTLTGISLGFLLLTGAFMLEGGRPDALFMLPAMLIVLGGTFAASLAGSSWEQIRSIPSIISIILNHKTTRHDDLIRDLVKVSIVVRRKGVLALEDELSRTENHFMTKMMNMMIDGTTPEVLESYAQTEMDFLSERHERNIRMFRKMGGYSPTMGIIGTVMGLISTMAAAGSEPETLIKHIATAFVATLWGIMMANLVYLPIADRLTWQHELEISDMQMIFTGIHSIQSGEMPSVVNAKLVGCLPVSVQNKYLGLNKKMADID